MVVTAPRGPAENVIHLPVNWETYKTIAAQLGESTNVRLSYNDGTLELMSPQRDHEAYKTLLDSMMTILSLEWGVELDAVASMTLEIDGQKGGEPDNSYYIQNAHHVVGLQRIDLTVLPPPDLVVEIDLSSSRTDKFGLYAALRVPEFWRVDYTGLKSYVLSLDGRYEPISESGVIPGLQLAWIDDFLRRRLEPRTAVLQGWREFIRHRKPKSEEGRT